MAWYALDYYPAEGATPVKIPLYISKGRDPVNTLKNTGITAPFGQSGSKFSPTVLHSNFPQFEKILSLCANLIRDVRIVDTILKLGPGNSSWSLTVVQVSFLLSLIFTNYAYAFYSWSICDSITIRCLSWVCLTNGVNVLLWCHLESFKRYIDLRIFI